MNIKNIRGRQILDSRGYPTVECDIELANGITGRASVPSGASTGSYEAKELRDNDLGLYQGKSVFKAVHNVNTIIKEALIGKNVEEQKEIDQVMITLDGTETKEKLGANAILAVSLASSHAAAKSLHIPLFSYFQKLGNVADPLLPVPMMNIINGGKHASGSTDIQEFMIMPIGARTFSRALEMGSNVFHTLGKVLHEKGYSTTVGDEGGYAPHVKDGNKEALDLILSAVKKAGYRIGEDIVLALDVAASELYENETYSLHTESRTFDRNEMIEWLSELVATYPIISIEDGFSEDDHEGWKLFTEKLGDKVQIVGDDVFVTNTKRLERGVVEKEANAILIKLNQIGTVTETIATVKMGQQAGWKCVISHRSGETEDTSISHFATGLATTQIKTGSLSRTDRVSKYNELLRIEELLGDKALFAGEKEKFINRKRIV